MLIPFSELFSRYNIKPIGAFHVGASYGQEVSDYYTNGIKSTVWIEAIWAIFEQLQINISKYPDAIAICACISDTDGKLVDFHVANNEGQSSSILEFGTHAMEHPTVKFVNTYKEVTRRLDTIIEKWHLDMSKYDFLNIDLQGAELLALKGMGKYLAGFKYAYIEVNEKELYKGCPMVDEIDDHLLQFGFKGVECKMTDWGWGDKFYIKQGL